MARSSSPRPDDNDCLRLPTTSSPRTGGAEKKESTDLGLSQVCRQYAKPSSISFFDRHHKNAHTAEDESVKSHSKSICQRSARTYQPCRRSERKEDRTVFRHGIRTPYSGRSASNRDPRDEGPQWLPSSHGSRGWDAGGGDDCEDPSRLFC